MSKRIYITAAIMLIIAFFTLLFFIFFEIYEYKDRIYPPREISNNTYYIMEKWLNETGHPVRVINYLYTDELPEITENVIMANSRIIFFGETEDIIKWIEKGNLLIINIEYDYGNLDDELSGFLSDFGITYGYEQKLPEFDETEERKKTFEQPPDFNSRIAFNIHSDNNNKIFSITDNSGIIRLAEIKIGEGALTVTGVPVFMNNYNIDKKQNAALSWRLTGDRDNNSSGILFVFHQNKKVSDSLLEIISRKGNLLPVFISAFLLIITGFWMVIPRFGLIFEEKQRASRPISDRFLAEIRFLKKYNALDYYLKFYDLEQDNEKKEKYNYRNLINKYRRLNDGRKKI